MNKDISNTIADHLNVIEKLSKSESLNSNLSLAIETIIEAFKADKKVMFCGNGGSAADAQHLATELSGRFYLNRAPLNAEALNVNTAFITAVANDMGYDKVFCRALRSKAKAGDVLIALSTSGKSENVIRAVEKANTMKVKTISLTGENGNQLAGISDIAFQIPSSDTPRIQEAHLLIGHIICEQVEKALFENE